MVIAAEAGPPAKLCDCSRPTSRGKPNHVRPPLTDVRKSTCARGRRFRSRSYVRSWP